MASVIPRSALIQPIDVNGRFRPIVGGVVGLGGCTVMATAIALSQSVVVTASHCTAFPWVLDGGQFQQPAGQTPWWGQELIDAPTYGCGPWFNRKTCRRADVAAYTITGIDFNFPEQTFALGSLARTANRVPGSQSVAGSTALAGFLEVVGSMAWAVQGEIVEKIGRTTGWTFGAVGATCVDDSFPGVLGPVVVVCTDRAALSARGGDSGSMVFKDLNTQIGGNQVLAVGIAVAANLSGTTTGYSSVNQIRQEIPSLCFSAGC